MSLECRLDGNLLQNNKAILCIKSESAGNYKVSVTYINHSPGIMFGRAFGVPTYTLSINYRPDCKMHMEIFNLKDVWGLADMATDAGYEFVDCGLSQAKSDNEMLRDLTKHVKKYVDNYLQYNKTVMH
jgi:hypothetical protein